VKRASFIGDTAESQRFAASGLFMRRLSITLPAIEKTAPAISMMYEWILVALPERRFVGATRPLRLASKT
jgi:hypothetical protein